MKLVRYVPDVPTRIDNFRGFVVLSARLEARKNTNDEYEVFSVTCLNYCDIRESIMNYFRLSSGPSLADGLHAIEAEILREKAEALGRAGLRLEEALDALEKMRETIDGIKLRLRHCMGSTEEMASLREAYSTLTVHVTILRERAYQAYQFLIIHREAVGLRNHLEVERHYKILERLR